VVVAIIFTFRVDPAKEELQEPGRTPEGFFVEGEDEI
jgi:hypothetical protein